MSIGDPPGDTEASQVSAAGHPQPMVPGHAKPAPSPPVGETLQSILGRHPLPQAQAVLVGFGVLAGLVALQRAGMSHGALGTASVNVAPNGQARLTGYGVTTGDPREDVMAAGRVICAALGVKPERDLGTRPGHTPEAWLVEAARTIAAGGAGPSAANALVLFADAAGRMAPGLRVQWSGAEIEKLAVPPAAISGAVDRLMTPAVRTSSAPGKATSEQPRAEPTPTIAAPHDGAGVSREVARSAGPTRSARVPWSAVWLALFLAVAAGAVWLRAEHPSAHPATGGIGAPEVAQTVAPTRAPPTGAGPDSVVVQYYELVAARNFDQALALWDADLRASLPAAQHPRQRFAETTHLVVNSARIVHQDSSTATVAVDLTEVSGGVQHDWIGTWRLVKAGAGWQLDTPDFRAA